MDAVQMETARRTIARLRDVLTSEAPPRVVDLNRGLDRTTHGLVSR
jgi:hypothetical protein